MVPRRVALSSAGALAVLSMGFTPAVAAPPTPGGCSFSHGTTTCVTTQSAVQTYESVEGEDGKRVSAGDVTVWGRACLAYEPTTWYYGAFRDSALEVTTTTTTTTSYHGRMARHDKKISSDTVVSEPAYRVTTGTLYCYTKRVLGPIEFEAPYPS